LCYRTQCVKINGVISDEHKVSSGIPQGSVLGPLLFIIFINDLPQVCYNLTRLFIFADDAKMYRELNCISDSDELRQNCQDVFNWSHTWGMKLNASKCKVLSIIKNKNSMQVYDYGFCDKDNVSVVFEHVDSMKDLGVTIDSNLSYSIHIYKKIKTAFKMLAIINRNFSDLDKCSFLLLYKCFVRSHIEYCSSVWNPYKVGIIDDLEKVQKRATKMIKECKKMSYTERLMFLQLPTLKLRRARGDMIQVFKILTGLYDDNIAPTLIRNTDGRTRGNSFKLSHIRSHYDFKKYSFCSRVVGLWNALPDSVVTCTSVNSFKNSLDNFWLKEEMYFNYKANLTGMII
jgi:hypothetical protein